MSAKSGPTPNCGEKSGLEVKKKRRQKAVRHQIARKKRFRSEQKYPRRKAVGRKLAGKTRKKIIGKKRSNPELRPRYWNSNIWSLRYWNPNIWSSRYSNSNTWSSSYWNSNIWCSIYWDSSIWTAILGLTAFSRGFFLRFSHNFGSDRFLPSICFHF